MPDPFSIAVTALVVGSKYLPKPMRRPIEAGVTNVLGCKYWIVGGAGSGKSTLHKVLADEDVAIGDYDKTARVAITRGGIGVVGDKSQQYIMHKKGYDGGGENSNGNNPTSEPLYLDAWRDHVREAHRYIFLYDLKSEFGDAFDIGEKMKRVVDFSSEHWLENETAFRFTLDCLLDTFDEEVEKKMYSQMSRWEKLKSKATEKKRIRKILILCTKIDQWQAAPWHEQALSSMDDFQWHGDAQRRLLDIVDEKQLQQRTKFEAVTGLATFLPGRRTHLANALSKLRR